MRTSSYAVAALAALGVVGFVGSASASSHREAPAIANDQAADNTDLWAWSTGDAATGTLHVVAAYIPLQEPSGGPNYPKFSDDVLYEVHVARGSASLDDVVTYQIKFTTAPLTKVDPADLAKPLGGGKEFFAQLAGSYAQTYSVTQIVGGVKTVIASGAGVPIPSIGPATQQVGLMIGAAKSDYETYAQGFIKSVDFGGGKTGSVWAGQRDDGFYVDLAGAFDLANFRIINEATGGMNPPTDNLAGYNCHAIAMDIPFAAIPTVAETGPFKDRLGVWASASRRKVRILRNDGSEQWAGPWTQVSRVGLPLVNELVIGLQDKDKYNRTYPKTDVANFGGYLLNPVIVRDAEAVGIYTTLGGFGYPAVDTACNGKSCKSGRTDIVQAINIGSDPTDPAGFPLTSSGDVLRVDPGIPSFFPNGRPLPAGNRENDVTDIMASVALYGYPSGLTGGVDTMAALGTPVNLNNSKSPLDVFVGGTNLMKVFDGVQHNDAAYTATIPYLATPWRGWDEGHGKIAQPLESTLCGPPTCLLGGWGVRAFVEARMRTALIVVAGFALLGCEKKDTGGQAAPLPSASAPSSPTEVLSPARRLALAPPGGSSFTDKLVSEGQRAVTKFPAKTDYWVTLGRFWIRKARESADPGYYENADACAAAALELDPGNRLAFGLRSQVLLNRHDFVGAMDMADRALARDREDLVALGVRSDACLELGRFEEAVKSAQAMIDLKPNLPSYVRASYLKWLYGNVDEAKRVSRLAIDAGKDPHDKEPGAWAIVQSAQLFWSEGDYSGAEAGYDLALAQLPDYAPALVGKGRAALTRGDGKAAAELLARAYKDSPLVDTAWYLGDAREMAGDVEGARAAYADVVKRGRQSDHRTLALYYATKNLAVEEAVRLAESEKKVRGDITTEDALAWSYYRAGKLKEAKEASDRANRLGTRDAQLWFHAGAIRLALGEKGAGLKLVKDALKLSPKFDVSGAAEATELLAKAEKGGK